jgi:type II secretory pathway pseudopilin PulG
MNLATKASQQGYAMAALLVAMAVMAVLLSVAMPTWSRMIQREKEEELIFRGNQYARAINQYQRRYANASPPNLDVLVEQHMLRKKYRDPFAIDEKGEFELLRVGSTGTGAVAARGISDRIGGAGATGTTGGRGGTGGAAAAGGAGRSGEGSRVGAPLAGSVMGRGATGGPIIGVASKNTAESIRVFNGKTHYNEWEFIAVQQATQAGGGAGSGQPGDPNQPGGPGGGIGGRGRGGMDGRGQQPGSGRSDQPPPTGGRGQIQPPRRGAQ